MRLSNEVTHVFERAKERVNVLVVRDVVTVVILRRLVDGGKPQHVDTQISEVVQLGGNTGDVPDAVAVRVSERARVDLVHDGTLPPVVFTQGDAHVSPCCLKKQLYWCVGLQKLFLASPDEE